jgi:sugar lactone lactonase YvrE
MCAIAPFALPAAAGGERGADPAILSGAASATATNPEDILISDATGELEVLDLESLTVTPFHQFDVSGNYDIQYDGPHKIVIANYNQHRVERFDLRTRQLEIIAAGPPLSRPIGIAVSPRGVYYIADSSGKIFSYDIGAGVLDLLAAVGPAGEHFTNPDGIVEDAQGRVVFTDFDGHIYRITPRDKHIESVASIPGAELNGVALLHGGDLVVASSDSPPALLRVNPDTGEISTLYQGTPFRNPEDVAVDSDGKNVYVLDSDYKGSFSDSKPAIYVFNLSTGTLSAVYVGPPLCACGIVDMLLRPFTGHP